MRSEVKKPLVSIRYVAAVLGVPPQKLLEVARDADRLYAPFILRQERGGKTKARVIDNPVGPMKFIQGRIKTRLLDILDLPVFITGGVKGRSTQSNASAHVGRPEVVSLDLKDFFPSITNDAVARMWCEEFGASRSVAWLLTRLTTYKGHLPQGSPVSNAVANLVALPFFARAHELCGGRGSRLTAYVDDLSISGVRTRDHINDIAKAASRRGLRVARRKTSVMPAHTRQHVTGHTVNRKLSNGRQRLDDAWRRLQAADSTSGEPATLQSLRGLTIYLATTCPEQARRLTPRLRQLEERHKRRKAENREEKSHGPSVGPRN
ncbi:MAG TPA: reverse transcriptase family protein [Polyangiaceae bacterium]|nr:reverse transcriptase family protein [Polyangiaceae bacterium]